MTSSHPVTYSRFLDREACSLARHGYQVTLVGIGPDSEAGESRGVRLIPVRALTGGRKLAALRGIAGIARRGRFDIYHCLDPWTLAIGLAIRRARADARLVYESSEWFPRMLVDREDLPGPVRHLGWLAVTWLEHSACRRADAVIETNATRSHRFLARGCKPVLVPNYPPPELLPEPAAERKPWIAYTGLVSRHRGFEQLLAALAVVVTHFPLVQLRVIGAFDPRDDIEHRARRFMEAKGISKNVALLGTLAYPEMFRALQPCLAGVVLLQPGRGNDYTGQPNKLFEFMGAGLGVVASDFPEMARVVHATGCGWLVDPTKPSAIAQALTEALARPGSCAGRGLAGREAVLKYYNWRVAERALLEAYGKLLT
jgi:glycosyltransferase involved in cell wall biosynthesis